jgi:hypothetical protein
LRCCCFTILLGRGTHPKYVQHLAKSANIQLTLGRYSLCMPSMSRSTADRAGAVEGLRRWYRV